MSILGRIFIEIDDTSYRMRFFFPAMPWRSPNQICPVKAGEICHQTRPHCARPTTWEHFRITGVGCHYTLRSWVFP